MFVSNSAANAANNNDDVYENRMFEFVELLKNICVLGAVTGLKDYRSDIAKLPRRHGAKEAFDNLIAQHSRPDLTSKQLWKRLVEEVNSDREDGRFEGSASGDTIHVHPASNERWSSQSYSASSFPSIRSQWIKRSAVNRAG